MGESSAEWAQRLPDGVASSLMAAIALGLGTRKVEEEDYTWLHRAAYYGHMGLIRALIDVGVNLDAQEGGDGLTPLHEAATRRT